MQRPDLNRIILTIRRIAIVLIMLFSYGYYRLSDTNQALANIGLVSFAAIMQFVPAALAGLYWRGANQRGAIAALSLGFLVWAYCLLFPTLLGPLQIDRMFAEAGWLHPQHLFGIQNISPLTHGVLWSMLVNVAALVIGSLRYQPALLDKIQASIFLHTSAQENLLPTSRGANHHATVRDARTLCHSILGEEISEQVFSPPDPADGELDPDSPVTRELVQRIERAIASVIGASSARHVVAKTLLGEDISAEDLVVLMDETSQAITFNRELLQSGFENISQGISVVDRQQNLVAWNSRYVELFEFPREFLHVGMPLEDILRYNHQRGEYGEGYDDQRLAARMASIRAGEPYSEERRRPNGRHIRSQGNPMPGGGFVTSYTDITDTVNAEELLRKVNEDLEVRVTERTRDLEAAEPPVAGCDGRQDPFSRGSQPRPAAADQRGAGCSTRASCEQCQREDPGNRMT